MATRLRPQITQSIVTAATRTQRTLEFKENETFDIEKLFEILENYNEENENSEENLQGI